MPSSESAIRLFPNIQSLTASTFAFSVPERSHHPPCPASPSFHMMHIPYSQNRIHRYCCPQCFLCCSSHIECLPHSFSQRRLAIGSGRASWRSTAPRVLDIHPTQACLDSPWTTVISTDSLHQLSCSEKISFMGPFYCHVSKFLTGTPCFRHFIFLLSIPAPHFIHGNWPIIAQRCNGQHLLQEYSETCPFTCALRAVNLMTMMLLDIIFVENRQKPKKVCVWIWIEGKV